MKEFKNIQSIEWTGNAYNITYRNENNIIIESVQDTELFKVLALLKQAKLMYNNTKIHNKAERTVETETIEMDYNEVVTILLQKLGIVSQEDKDKLDDRLNIIENNTNILQHKVLFKKKPLYKRIFGAK